jgi:predicted oxidoreductase
MSEQRIHSPLIAGTMTWGIWGRNYNKEEMIQLMKHCLDAGINSFDHADIYGDYTTEASFGTALAESNISRDSIQLISKCGIQLEGGQRNNKIKHYDYSKNYIISSAEQSLKNLKTDYLDLLLLHRPSPLMNAGEIATAIEQLKQQGKILDFGVSNFNSAQIDYIQNAIKINYNQIEFSVTHLDPMLDGTLDYLQLHRIKPMCWAPLGKVFKINDTQTKRLLEAITPLTEKYETSVAALLLAWIIKHPAKITPVFGTTSRSRINELLRALEIELDETDWFILWSAASGENVP